MKPNIPILLSGLFGIISSGINTEAVSAENVEPQRNRAPAIQHRLTWDEWFYSIHKKDLEFAERTIKVFWDGELIGDFSRSHRYLDKIKPESNWEVIIDMPNRQEVKVNEDGSFYCDPFIGSCDFLGDWFKSGVKLTFKRLGAQIQFRVIQVLGKGHNPNLGSSWDNIRFKMDGKIFEDGKILVSDLKKIEWKKGDFILFIFPNFWNESMDKFQDGAIRPYLIELQKVYHVDASVASSNGFGASGIISYPLR